ncbi:hypothetical protein F2P56_010542 [Juglans regia]|uniref:Retrovirus-related Pol polyprotein from transposon TNT 1-94-like beta-barrel domain-containing protein n=1 Tax=Juglans regia TaxID=51240 RepID=A0A833XMS2_JUGRE|nr:hypothetical protein F2P56_010542 [Juglans regia]
MTDYYNKVRSLASTLIASGHPLNDVELSIYLLAGLGTEYESLVTSLITRPYSLFPHQIFSYLLNHESRLSHQTQTFLSGTTVAANNTSKYTPHAHPSRGRGNSFLGGRQGQCNGRGIIPQPPQQPYSFFLYPDMRHVCQVCYKPSHLASACYYRYDHVYPTPPPPTFTANYSTLNSAPTSSTTWFPDTNATHHFTYDVQNLNVDSSLYQGSDQVCIGDGSGLPSQHVGSTHFNTNNGKFLLKNLLHVPCISRNLLSVRQFFHDNNVFFEFHSSMFFVKDARSQETLLQGRVKDGMYVFQSAVVPRSTTAQAFLGVQTLAQLWHSQLGHPSSCTTSLII